jgi:hypothetical protein
MATKCAVLGHFEHYYGCTAISVRDDELMDCEEVDSAGSSNTGVCVCTLCSQL